MFKNILNIVPQNIENKLKNPLIITFIVLFQGTFGSLGINEIPEKLLNLQKYAFIRFLYILSIALTATQDIEISIICTLIYFLTIYAIRTPKEREESPII